MFRFLLALFLVVAASAKPPNVIVILADDQGWGDLSMNGNRDLSTPHIDSLAAQGASFDRFFVQPVCAPTRAEFLTGRFFSRTGVRGVSTGDERLNPDERTLADVLKEAGYATAAFGKWHNGTQPPYHPNDRGFEHYEGFTSGHWGHYFDPWLERNGELFKAAGYITDDLTDRALKFMGENTGGPFFCYIAYCTPHSPMQVPDRFFDKFADKKLEMEYGGFPGREAHTRAALAMVENVDENVGRVLDSLKRSGIADNTIVIYFSDNGPNGPRWNGGMKGTKGSVDEGGVRVPCVVRWPERIKPGTAIKSVAGAVDLLPTLAAAAGVSVGAEKPLDGVNLLPALEGKAETPQDRLLISVQGRGERARCSVRSQRFRWVKGGGLYDPMKDPGQKKDLTAEYPDEGKRMRDFATKYLAEVAPNLKNDQRPFTVGYSPVTWLPARDGVPKGGVKRSGRAPNCSFFTHWTKPSDSIEWHVKVGSAGRYEAILHYTCPESDVGSSIELSLGDAKLHATITEAHDPPLYGMESDRSDRGGSESFVKDFKPMRLGEIDLPEGEGTLRLKAIEVPGDSVAEVRWIELRRSED
ncbi:N-acetylgalactosamine-6-sulfatase [Haloferula helveola]|uniref:N-acetylgalactosamine-6-sulfatase n=1 Tax=Haloferula helveola TaxID=490095 RepID=A0ABM7R732_9BACT|nr:N-acetylgalactosamine-6-sulfatase [Haloferula helveola]